MSEIPLPDLDTLTRFEQMGDPLADAAVAEIAALGESGVAALEQGFSGVFSDNAPAIVALFRDALNIPWADPERLKRGSDAYLAIGASWIGLSLGPGSLTHTYSAPGIAKLLVETGNLTRMAYRRLLETGAWNVATVLPNGLSPGGSGFRHNLEVRLLHARVRRAVLAKGWDGDAHPINQVELARTWLDFTYIPFSALGHLGISFTAEDLDDLYHLWQVSAHLLGVDPALYRGVKGQAEGRELLSRIDRSAPLASADSQRLTRAMLDAVAELLAPQLRVSPAIAFELSCAILRKLHGAQLADALGVKRTWASAVLPMLVAANRIRRWRQRHSPSYRAASIAQTTQTLVGGDGQLNGQTTYQREVRKHASDTLPETIA